MIFKISLSWELGEKERGGEVASGAASWYGGGMFGLTLDVSFLTSFLPQLAMHFNSGTII
jgi:hypothetical protein